MKRYIVLVFALVATFLTAQAQLTEQQQIQKLNYAYQYIRNNYVDDVPLEPLVEEAIIATLKELDPHSRYLSAQEMSETKNRLHGEFAGIGIKYHIHNDTLVVRSTLPNSPAQRANILPNDRITAINGSTITGLNSDSVATLLKGDVGSKVTLYIERRNVIETKKVTLERKVIETSAITSVFSIDDIGYIACESFTKSLDSEFYSAYKSLGNIKALVVDLRDNGGGAISSAIDLTSLFLNKGDIIVTTVGKDKEVVYEKRSNGNLGDIPLVVLINENSASASEIFAGAIQDYDRGVIIGHTSFGKGLVQRIIELKDGSGLCLTISRYKTPSGRIIQRPYTMGNGEKYLADSVRFMHPDSIPRDSNLLFKTLKNGRMVYGGGGITPDIYINKDSLRISTSIIEAQSKGIFEHTITDYWDLTSLDALRSDYPTVEQFCKEYEIDQLLWDIFYNYTHLSANDLTERDLHYVRAMLMTTMAEQLYGPNERHYVYISQYDYVANEAFAIANSPQRMQSILE